jgi:hypothetical protein
MRVELLSFETDRVTVFTEATIVGRHGALRIEGEDWGPVVEQMWGRDDHEYIVTIDAAHRRDIQRLLIEERFAGDAEAIVEWLSGRGYRIEGTGRGTVRDVRALRDWAVRIDTTGGAVTVASDDFDRMTLGMLKDLFDSKRFEHDAAFRQWLEGHGIPSDLWVY